MLSNFCNLNLAFVNTSFSPYGKCFVKYDKRQRQVLGSGFISPQSLFMGMQWDFSETTEQ